MKALILMSSIFYFLGLKIGHHTTFIRKIPVPAVTETSKHENPPVSKKNYLWKEETKKEMQTDTISMKKKVSPPASSRETNI